MRILAYGLLSIGAVALFGPAVLLLIAGWLLLKLHRWMQRPRNVAWEEEYDRLCRADSTYRY